MLLKHSLIKFCDSYRENDWNSLISQSNQSIVICSYYWNKWTEQHQQTLERFLLKDGSSIHFFFSNAYSEILRLFPNLSLDELKIKILQTYQPLCDFLRHHHLPSSKVKATFIPFPLNYSFQCFDDHLLTLSIFEIFRSTQIDAPSFLIDLNQNPNTKAFYQKELKGYEQFQSV